MSISKSRDHSKLLAGLFAVLVASTMAYLAARGATPEVRDFDRPYFEGAKATLLDTSAEPGARRSAMSEIVMRNANAAPDLLAPLLSSSDSEIRWAAAEWLARFGDPRGLDFEVKCLTDPVYFERRHHAARLLGNSKKVEYAPAIAQEVRLVMQRHITAEGAFTGRSEDLAMVSRGTLALARIGRREDVDLVLSAWNIERLRLGDGNFLEALGYIDDPRARKFLWSVYQKELRPATCEDPGLGVDALLPLSRLKEPLAIQRLSDILRGVGTVRDWWEPQKKPALCSDRERAFQGLRPRDAENFADVVFEVMAQEPEGIATREAWQAMGIMHPKGLAVRVFKLAVSRKPQWKTIAREQLWETVAALDPSLSESFWREYDVQEIPAKLGARALIAKGLGHLMFRGTEPWNGD